jgi:hypothetical protein
LPKRREEEVPEIVATEFTVACKPMTPELRLRCTVLIGECKESHSDITRRKHSKLLSQPATRTAIICHRHNGNDIIGQLASGTQSHCQTMSATKCHNLHDYARSISR